MEACVIKGKSMRILNVDGIDILSPDLSRGFLTEERVLIARHDAAPGTPDKGHYEVIKEYPNGGKDVKFVIDVPGVPDKQAWDEYETIMRYTEYTEEQLNDMQNEKSNEERIADLEEALLLILSGVTE